MRLAFALMAESQKREARSSETRLVKRRLSERRIVKGMGSAKRSRAAW
jgi:hypothetical protein